MSNFTTEDGFPRSNLEGAEQMFGWFLEQDVQFDDRFCLECIKTLAMVQAGELEKWEGTGNAFAFKADSSQFIIEPLWFEDSAMSISLEKAIELLREWLAFIEYRKTGTGVN